MSPPKLLFAFFSLCKVDVRVFLSPLPCAPSSNTPLLLIVSHPCPLSLSPLIVHRLCLSPSGVGRKHTAPRAPCTLSFLPSVTNERDNYPILHPCRPLIDRGQLLPLPLLLLFVFTSLFSVLLFFFFSNVFVLSRLPSFDFFSSLRTLVSPSYRFLSTRPFFHLYIISDCTLISFHPTHSFKIILPIGPFLSFIVRICFSNTTKKHSTTRCVFALSPYL